MSLQGSITEHQDAVIKFYHELEQRFSENQLIRDLWNAMAHDIMLQKRSMNVLPPSFWHQLKAGQNGLSRAISEASRQISEKEDDPSLRRCFERTLAFEEPAILRIYVPIIRKLRENWTDRALDFYIIVKAHLARIMRITQMYAGDPVIIQRSNLLLQHFEKDVQEPPAEVVQPVAHRVHAGQPPVGRYAVSHAKKAASKQKTAPAIVKRAKSHHGRAKPLVEKILPRRRARR